MRQRRKCRCPHRRAGADRRDRPGIILLITLVILVVLATLGYTLTVRMAARRHRDQYIIDYCQAKHACASGLKYALASLGELQIQLISRPNEPDFSDVFALSEDQYQRLLAQVDANALTDGNTADANSTKDAQRTGKTRTVRRAQASRAGMDGVWDINDVNDPYYGGTAWAPPRVEIPGPYGPPWPLVTEPIEFEIGSAKVKIEVEDENAKYPLGWTLLADEKWQAQATVGWVTFCEWMGYTTEEIGRLREDLAKIGKIKPFKTEFKAAPQAAPPAPPSRVSRPTSRSTTVVRRAGASKAVPAALQIEQQNKEFARLFHSPLVDAALLARPSIVSDTRQESALKYLGLWATRTVNINSAPRQVLEAALAFGSVADAPKMAELIIQKRKIKPIADVNELKQGLLGYSNSIDKCKDFVTTTSTVFTVRVTARSGVATVTAVAAVSKEADKIKRIAVISD
jgi:type II secretory pathway component PulK